MYVIFWANPTLGIHPEQTIENMFKDLRTKIIITTLSLYPKTETT